MELFYKALSQNILGLIYHKINTTEMVSSFDDIIHIGGAVRNAYCVCFKNISRLVLCQFAPFNMIGIISQLDLYFMIYSAVHSGFLFNSEP